MLIETNADYRTLVMPTYPGRYEKFNRKTFNPSDNGSIHAHILRRLRQQGHSRRLWYSNRHNPWTCHFTNHYRCCTSMGLEALDLPRRERGLYLDLGCGDSADAAIAATWGYNAIGLDLFPPTEFEVRHEDLAPFVRADVADAIPFADSSVCAATSYAMADLIEPSARPNFYREIFRVLAPGAVFALYGIELVNGYGFTRSVQKQQCEAAGFVYTGAFHDILKFKKPFAGKATNG